MPNVDIFTIKANSEIITAIHERVKGSCISTDLCGSGKELTCDVNWHFNNEIVGALKEISKERDCIVTFAFVEDANYYTEKHHHEVTGGCVIFTGLTLNHLVDSGYDKLPCAVKDVYEKLMSLDTVTGEKVTYFPDTKTECKHDGETFIINKRGPWFSLTVTDATGGDITTKYRDYPQPEAVGDTAINTGDAHNKGTDDFPL